MLFRALVSHSVHSHPEGTNVLRGPLFGCRACERGVVRPMRFLLFSWVVQQPLGHPRLESTDALKQRMRFVGSRVVAKSLLDHFSNMPVAFCSLFFRR